MADRYASLKQGLVGAWIPSVSGSGLLLPDLSGYGNNGSLVGMDASDWVASGDGRALDFDGSNDFVDYGRCDQLSGLGFVSCSFWCFPKSTNDMFPLIRYNTVAAIGSERRADFFALQASGGILYPVCYFSIAGDPFSHQSFTTIAMSVPVNAWSHVAISVGLATNAATIAVNGVTVTATRTSGGTPPTATAAQGTVTWRSQTYMPLSGIQAYFDGQLDDIRIYNRILTPSEIRLLASKRGIGLEPRKPKITFTDLGVQKAYSVVRVKETDHANLRQGLVGAWCPSLPNGGSGNTLPDVSGRGNNGTLVGMDASDWVSSQYGRALDFDGTDDTVDCGTAVTISGATTVSGWINRKGVPPQNNAVICAKGGLQGDSNSTFALYFNTIQGWSWFVVDGSNNLAIVRSNTFTSLNVWYHVCGVASASGLQIYVNGILQNTAAGGVTKSSTHTTAFAAITDALNTYASSCQLDDIRIYNRVLSESEIRLLASRPGIGLRQESHRQTFYQFPSFQPAIARRSSAIIGGGIT